MSSIPQCGGLAVTSKLRPTVSRALAHGALVLAGAWVAWTCGRLAMDDTFQPLAYVTDLARSEDPLHVPLTQYRHHRVGYFVDDLAGPRDVVAVDAGYDTWLYPMFGRDYRRPLRFIGPSLGGPAVIPADAKWVAIDRGRQEFLFGHPAMTDLRQSLVRQYYGRGTPASGNFTVLDQLQKDPSFEIVFHDPASNQALFRRK